LALPIAFILVVTFGALDARTCTIDWDEAQSNALTAIFDKRFYLTQTATQQRSAKSALCPLAVGQVAALIVLLDSARPRHVTQP
jgi:hypothetical protein